MAEGFFFFLIFFGLKYNSEALLYFSTPEVGSVCFFALIFFF